MRITAVLLLAIGVSMMVVAMVWRPVASSSLFWDEDKAEEYMHAVADLHASQTESAMSHAHESDQHGHGTATGRGAGPPADKLQRVQSGRRYLVRVRWYREHGGSIMRWVGVGLALIGVFLFQWKHSHDRAAAGR